jgi:small subunit ribosomal protein S7
VDGRVVRCRQPAARQTWEKANMPRRAKIARREVLPDAKYHSKTVTMFINKVMLDGKKSTAERIMYDALDRVAERSGRSPLDMFEQAIRNATPVVEVKPRRVGGATYQVPVDIRTERRMALAIRWLLRSARSRPGKSMAEKLSGELLDAANNQGATIKRREDTHRMADANRAFVHYRW